MVAGIVVGLVVGLVVRIAEEWAKGFGLELLDDAVETVALVRCSPGHQHVVSQDALSCSAAYRDCAGGGG